MAAQFRFWKELTPTAGISAGDAVSEVLRISELSGCRELVFYILFGAGTSAGAFQVESAHDPEFAGVWAPEGSPVAWVAASRVHVLRITGLSFAERVRVSTAIVGGTIRIWAGGN